MKKINSKRRNFLSTSAKVAGAIGALSLSANELLAAPKGTNTNAQKGDTMKLTPKAKENFQKLFGNFDIPLAKNDPEFFGNFINFAFDENLEHCKDLKENERLLIILCSLVASHSLREFRAILNAALNVKISPIAIKEVIYQNAPYVGISRAVECLEITNEVFSARGIKLPLENQGTTTRENRAQKGLQTQRVLFGEAIDKGNAAAPKDQKHIREFLSANCFGDYYTRGGLDLHFRELLTFVILLSFGGVDAQVRAHIQGNLNIGHTRSKLISVVTALVPYIGYPRSLNALSAISELSPLQ